MAVVLIQTGPYQRLQVAAKPLANALVSLSLPQQRARQRCVELDAFVLEMLTQPQALLLPQRAKYIVVISAK